MTNKIHNITPTTVSKKIAANIADMDYVDIEKNPAANKKKFKWHFGGLWFRDLFYDLFSYL